MKIILLQNVKSLGQKGEIKEVKDGFAQNFLIPQGLAAAASQEKIQSLEKEKEKTEKFKDKKIKEQDEIINKISGKKITLSKKASEKGKLFAAVSLDEILTALDEQHKIKLNKQEVELEEHVKEVGEHEINLKIKDKKVKILIEVMKGN